MTAADLPALVSELFDGDGTWVDEAAVDGPVRSRGADADGDDRITAADPAALVRDLAGG